MIPIIKKNAINFGLISGAIAVLVTLLMYIINLKLFVNVWIGFGLIGVWIVIGIVLLQKCKKEQRGVLSFKEGFTAYFVSALIGISISTLFNIFLFNYFDTQAREIITEHLVDFQVEMLEKFNSPQEQIAEVVQEIKENSQFSLKGQVMGFFQALIGAIILGLILAAIFKSRNKEIY
ncbi:uncharacterized protein DUF4199 [Flavobacterium croceum DSM 17960]|uniref:Uncharacterized protein DUF4199 n=1 Tax=Flavobacterium croceum DSM 17960 TaxID=1121886 RepID=A0A2S4N8R6_9FLAO|nr:DUF4199 domain-containing protein [Flavobacterium croceum]POS02084.1 uncharacterized protein DUF4199 [Flavobacterium croceum DSM 17960]